MRAISGAMTAAAGPQAGLATVAALGAATGAASGMMDRAVASGGSDLGSPAQVATDAAVGVVGGVALTGAAKALPVAAKQIVVTIRGVRPAAVMTPHGKALQAATPGAQAALANAKGGATLYRQGQFGMQNTADAQFWSFQNPAATPGYANSMGIPGGVAPKPDWIMGGSIKSGTKFITRAAPGILSNEGGSLEAVTPTQGVGKLWFHMPD